MNKEQRFALLTTIFVMILGIFTGFLFGLSRCEEEERHYPEITLEGKDGVYIATSLWISCPLFGILSINSPF